MTKEQRRRRSTTAHRRRWCLLPVATVLLLLVMVVPSARAQQAAKGEGAEQRGADQQEEKAAPLPAPSTEEGGGAGSIPQLQFGQKMRFDELGPVIINKDGTTRRIINWHKMTKWEQERTLARIAKRNQERMAELQQGQQTKEEQEAKDKGEL